MTRGISDTVKGISYAADPLTASFAPPEFASAAKNFAFAAALGVELIFSIKVLVQREKENSDKTTNN